MEASHTASDPVQRILSALEGVKRGGSGWTARCPAHEDHQNSLSVGQGKDGRALLHCHAMCDSQQVMDALGLEFTDLWPDRSGPKLPPVAGEYEYRDEKGRLLFVVERRIPKAFVQRRPDGMDGWIYNMEGVRRVPYRLPELLAAIERGEWVLVVEGEKDVDNAKRHGLPQATCNPMGAGKWRDDWADLFTGANVVVIEDNDDAGRKHAAAVAECLSRTASIVKIVKLPGLPEHGDLTDWLYTGGSRARLAELVKAAPNVSERAYQQARESASLAGIRITRASAIEKRPLNWLWKPQLPLGKLTLLAGDPSTGKSFISLSFAGTVSTGEAFPGAALCTDVGDVTILQYEDDPGDTTIGRLEGMGADLDRIHFLSWSNPDGTRRPFTARDLPALAHALEREHRPRLIIVDPITSFTASSSDGNSEHGIRAALQPLVDLAAEHGAAVLGVIHTNKSTEANHPLDRLIGSRAWGALARSVLFAGMDVDTGRRALFHIKCNLAKQAPYPIEYALDESRGFYWKGENPEIDLQKVLRPPKRKRDD